MRILRRSLAQMKNFAMGQRSRDFDIRQGNKFLGRLPENGDHSLKGMAGWEMRPMTFPDPRAFLSTNLGNFLKRTSGELVH
jgi:hypothetical protein